MATAAPTDILEPSLGSVVEEEFVALGSFVVEETIGFVVVEVVVEETLESDGVEEKLDLLVQIVVLFSLAVCTSNLSDSYLT